MAIFAANLDVRPSQREITEVVIKGGVFPIEGCMTGSAVRTKATIMLIILLMTGIAISGCALERVILMTFLTGYPGMFPLQFEGRQVMVESCLLPPLGCMADITGRAKAQFVRIVRTVAGKAFLWRSFKIGHPPRIYMAKNTFHFPMSAGQSKC